MADMKRAGMFSLVLPVLALLVSVSFVLFPAASVYNHLKHVPHSSSGAGNDAEVYVIIGQFQIPAKSVPHMVFEMETLRQQGPICLLNAPGFLVYALLAGATGHSAHWSPESIGPFLWRVIAIPICALPAWWIVGRGIDGLIRRRQLRLTDMIASFLLVLASLVLSVGLRFGLTAEERLGQDVLAWATAGFGYWAALFGIPFSAWLYQRSRRFRPA